MQQMGIFDDVTNWTKKQATTLSEEAKKIKNKKFMEATAAGCAMVAFADGAIKPEEKEKMVGFIQRNDALNVFDMTQVIAAFEKVVKGFEFDIQIGKGEALKIIGKVKKGSDEAKLLVRVCCAVGTADDNFDENEKAAVRDICRELELNPDEFGLQPGLTTDAPKKPIPAEKQDDGMPEWMRTK